MSSISHRSKWSDPKARDLRGLREVFNWDPFENWHRNGHPEWSADEQFHLGIKFLAGWNMRAEADECFRRVLRISERTFKEDKLHQERPRDFWPGNRGHLLRVRAIAAGCLGQLLDCAALIQSSDDYLSEAPAEGLSWDSYAQAHYLTAIRLALLSGDLKRTQELLSTRRSFKWHATEHDLLRRMLATNRPPGAVTLEEVDQYFDVIRDPDFKPKVFMDLEIARVEWAAIRDRYFISPDGQVDWNRAIAAIAA